MQPRQMSTTERKGRRKKKHLSARNKAALPSPSHFFPLTRRVTRPRRLAITSQREERERKKGGGRLVVGVGQAASTRCCDISEGGRKGAKSKDAHIQIERERGRERESSPSPPSLRPPPSNFTSFFFFLPHHPFPSSSSPPSSAPVSARLRLGDKYGSWSRTQRPGAHFSLTFVRATTNKTAKGPVGRGGDKNLQAIFSHGRTRRKGQRGLQT